MKVVEMPLSVVTETDYYVPDERMTVDEDEKGQKLPESIDANNQAGYGPQAGILPNRSFLYPPRHCLTDRLTIFYLVKYCESEGVR